MTGAGVLAAACAALAALALAVPRVRNWFASITTGVWLLAAVAALAVAGIAIGQRLPPEAYVQRYGPFLGPLLLRSGLTSVFRSWYFVLVAWSLALSILSCSLRRARALVRSRRMRAVSMLATHVSIVVIMAGGVVNGVYGFKRAPERFLGRGEVIGVPEGEFDLRVDEARTEFRDGRLSEYVSVVTVIENDEEVARARIEVNHPLVHNGIGVYQYGMLPSARSVDEVLLGARVPRVGEDDLLLELAVPFREQVPVPGTDLSVKAIEFYSDFTYDIERGTAELASVWHDNPAVLVQVYQDGLMVGDSWLLVGFGGHGDDAEMPCRLALLDYRPDHDDGLTRFEFSRQPGTGLLYAGFGALSLSLFLAIAPRRKPGGRS